MLILAATPIGNLSDASQRLIEALGSAEYIAAEDTRSTHKLAHSLGVKLTAKLFSLHEHNEAERIEQILDLAETADVLVVSDAGMPTVSDPGFILVRAAVERGIEVSVIPGASAVLSALAVSGLPTDRFAFDGFLPRKSGERRKAFENLLTETRTVIFFESPHRILESLQDAAAVLGNERRASVSRELTKKFEQTVRGSLAELVDWAQGEIKGEIVLVISGAKPATATIEDLVPIVLSQREAGLSLKQAVAEVAAAHNVSKSDLYQRTLEAKAQVSETPSKHPKLR